MVKILSLLVILSFCCGCSTIHDMQPEQEDNIESWKNDPFMHRTTKIVPIISKTVVLSEGKKKEQKEE